MDIEYISLGTNNEVPESSFCTRTDKQFDTQVKAQRKKHEAVRKVDLDHEVKTLSEQDELELTGNNTSRVSLFHVIEFLEFKDLVFL